MRTSLTRAVSGAAIAAATVLALAGPASAKPLTREHTTLSIVEQRSVIKAGQTDKVGGRLAHAGTGLGAEAVLLDRWNGKRFVAVQSGVTGKLGNVGFTVTPGVTARYELVFLGTSTLAPSHSGVVTVKVLPKPVPRLHTTLSIVESKSVIKAGQTDKVSGRLAHAGTGLAAQAVLLERWNGKRFVAVQSGVTGPAGGVAFTVAPSVTAKYELVFLGTKTLAPSHSGVVTVKVS
jgi:hypothetical protein